MCGRAGIILLAIFATVFSLGAAGAPSPARSDIKSHFGLPAMPLDKALRDLAVQAKCNISYDPSIVAGLQAPALSGDFTIGRALSLLLKGTKLRAVNISENTIQIVEMPQSTSSDAGSIDYTDGENKSRDKKELEEIVVTGTHIVGVSSASPVIEIGREEIERSGFQTIGDLMLSVPQNFGGGYNPGTAVANSYVNNR